MRRKSGRKESRKETLLSDQPEIFHLPANSDSSDDGSQDAMGSIVHVQSQSRVDKADEAPPLRPKTDAHLSGNLYLDDDDVMTALECKIKALTAANARAKRSSARASCRRATKELTKDIVMRSESPIVNRPVRRESVMRQVRRESVVNSRPVRGESVMRQIRRESVVNSRPVRRESVLNIEKSSYHLVPEADSDDDDYDADTSPRIDLVEAGSCRNRADVVLSSDWFQGIIGFVIVANSVVVGLETDLRDILLWEYLEHGFLICFLVELLLRFYVMRGELFDPDDKDFNWNIFDVFVVGIGCIDVLAGLLFGKRTGSSETIFRIVRLLRVIRVFRLIRFLKPLYLLAFGMADAITMVMWVTVLMFFVIYVFSIVMVQCFGCPDESDKNFDFLTEHFGTVPASMLSLFVIMSSPNLPLYQEEDGLFSERPALVFFVVFFIISGSFGLLGLLNGVISEGIFEKTDLRKQEERAEHELLRKHLAGIIEELFNMMDLGGEPEATIDAVYNIAPSISHTFENCGIFLVQDDLESIIRYMDIDNDGKISRDEFMRGLLVLAEGVRPVSIQEVHHEVGACRVKLSRLEQSITDLMIDVRAAVNRAQSESKALGAAMSSQCEGQPSTIDDLAKPVQTPGQADAAAGCKQVDAGQAEGCKQVDAGQAEGSFNLMLLNQGINELSVRLCAIEDLQSQALQQGEKILAVRADEKTSSRSNKEVDTDKNMHPSVPLVIPQMSNSLATDLSTEVIPASFQSRSENEIGGTMGDMDDLVLWQRKVVAAVCHFASQYLRDHLAPSSSPAETALADLLEQVSFKQVPMQVTSTGDNFRQQLVALCAVVTEQSLPFSFV